METENLTAAETAVIIKTALRRNFPEAKFSVTSKCFPGGSSVNVRWRNGPPVKGVDKTYQWGGAKVYYQRGHWPA